MKFTINNKAEYTDVVNVLGKPIQNTTSSVRLLEYPFYVIINGTSMIVTDAEDIFNNSSGRLLEYPFYVIINSNSMIVTDAEDIFNNSSAVESAVFAGRVVEKISLKRLLKLERVGGIITQGHEVDRYWLASDVPPELITAWEQYTAARNHLINVLVDIE